jgi:hypothetical protein
MASDEFIIKKESDDVDLSLNNLKTLYSVKEKYRRRQKNSAGNYIPFPFSLQSRSTLFFPPPILS